MTAQERTALYEKTREQIISYPILDYANMIGLHPIRKGTRYYTLQEADSVMINPEKNLFIRNSTGACGTIIDFSIEFEGKSPQEAFKDLSNLICSHVDNPYTQHTYKPIKRESAKSTQKKFKLPPAANTNKNVYAYLLKTRKIAMPVVESFIKNKNLYQDTHNNCVFVSYNENGEADFACLRGTNTYQRFLGDVAGCNYDNCFYINHHAHSLIVTESVIDSMSVMSVMQQHGRNLNNYNFLALAGTQKAEAVFKRISKDNNIDQVILALDNDLGGHTAIEEIKNTLMEKGWSKEQIIEFLPTAKDWNQELQNRVTAAENAQKHTDMTFEESEEVTA